MKIPFVPGPSFRAPPVAVVAATLCALLWAVTTPLAAQEAAAPAAPASTAATALAGKTSLGKRLVAKAPATAAAVLPMPLEAEPLVMGVGEIRMLPVQGKIKRIALGNGAFASATTVDNHLMLIGEAAGQTSMMIWTESQIRAFRLRVMPAGSIESRQFLDQIVAASNQRLKLQDFDSRVVVSGDAPKATVDQLAGLSKFIPTLVVNVREDRETTRSVLFRLHFVEVSKSLLESLGVQWAKDAAGPVFGAQGVARNTGIYNNIPSPQGNTNLLDPDRPFVSIGGRTSGVFLGLATTIASRLNFGASDGDTRVLASPELTAISGGKARLQVGGEVPIPLAGAFGTQTVEFKPYGIIFNIEPVIVENDTIMAKISTELSQIDPTVSVGGIPGFLTRMTSTEISVRPGQMVALSGLINSELSTAIDKVPGLGNVPVLGRLFRSDAFRNKRTDLVVLLEPEIVGGGVGMAERLRQRGVQGSQEFEDRVRDITPAPPPPASRVPAPDPDPYTN